MRTKVKTSFSKPGALVQWGVPVLCEGTSRAVRTSSIVGCGPAARRRWASAATAKTARLPQSREQTQRQATPRPLSCIGELWFVGVHVMVQWVIA